MLQELVGDVQLTEEAGPPEEFKKSLHVKDMPATESQTSVEREKHELMGLVVYRRRCRKCDRAADYRCTHVESSEEETAVPTDCCHGGFLRDENQLEDYCRRKLVVEDRMCNLSYEVRLLSTEATVDSTWFMIGFTRGLGGKLQSVKSDRELALLVLEKRVVKSSQYIEVVSVEISMEVMPPMVMRRRQ